MAVSTDDDEGEWPGWPPLLLLLLLFPALLAPRDWGDLDAARGARASCSLACLSRPSLMRETKASSSACRRSATVGETIVWPPVVPLAGVVETGASVPVALPVGPPCRPLLLDVAVRLVADWIDAIRCEGSTGDSASGPSLSSVMTVLPPLVAATESATVAA